MYERTSRTLFSSDLLIRFGRLDTAYVESSLGQELASLTGDAMLSAESAERLKAQISALAIKQIAAGHGPYIRL